MDKIKFRSAHYYHKDKTFSHFSYWGIIDHKGNQKSDCFTSPSSSSNSFRKTEDKYIGRNDKNDKEIYESDILWHSSSESHVKIKYDTSTCAYLCVGLNDAWDQFLYEFRFNDLEVVGNLHENQELLK